MDYITLGKTKLLVSKTAFGAESLDCDEIGKFGDEAEEKVCAIVREAYSGGINFFDTSRSKPESEKRLGAALHGIRQNVLLATKTASQSVHEIRHDLDQSLDALECDYVDLFQLENPLVVPEKNGNDGIYNELLRMKDKGVIRHIGLATTDYEIARKAVGTGLYETVQFPFSMISPDSVSAIVELCAEKDVGFIAMQPLNGGIVSDISLGLGFFQQYDNAVPVWGIHTQDELQQILYFNNHPPVINDDFKKEIDRIRFFYN